MKTVDTLIISGASLTSSTWYTWADILVEVLKPKQVINLAAKGVGNYYISTSCINNLLENNYTGNVLCMPMFTSLDKFDLYVPPENISEFLTEKHKPVQINGNVSEPGTYGFWGTGVHWPGVKQLYKDNFYNSSITAVNTLLQFYTLETLCHSKSIELLPVFDNQIWQVSEEELLDSIDNKHPIRRNNLLEDPLVRPFVKLVGPKWIDFVPLITFAMENNLDFYNDINRLHPPSSAHLAWAQEYLLPILQKEYVCHPIAPHFIKKIETFSKAWQ